MAGSKRERELARQRAARQLARRVERDRRRKRRSAVLASVVAVALVASLAVAAGLAARDGGDADVLAPEPTAGASSTADPTDAPTGEPDPSTSPVADAVTVDDCVYTPGRDAARPVELPGEGVDRETPYTATVDTSSGQLQFELFTADAPCTVHSFRQLAAQDFFDDTPCHRLTDRGIFVLQCGDPSGTGTGGPGYTFEDENLEGATYERGIVAMANSGPDTNGSQFFLVYQDSALPPNYTPWGRLSEQSLAALDAIAAAGASAPSDTGNTAPNTPVQITDVRVEPTAP